MFSTKTIGISSINEKWEWQDKLVQNIDYRTMETGLINVQARTGTGKSNIPYKSIYDDRRYDGTILYVPNTQHNLVGEHTKKLFQIMFLKNWKRLNPEYEIKYYNDADIRNFLKKYYPKSYLDYFNMLDSNKGAGPIKADFWRVCILYKFGGIL